MKNRIHRLFNRGRALLSGTPEFVRTYQSLLAALGEQPEPEYDLVYVLPPAHVQGWILDAICREIDEYVDGKTAFGVLGEDLPPARAYFYSHYGYLRDTVLRQPDVLHAKNLLFYTHPRKLWYPNDELVYVMNMADSVISMCSLFVPELIRQGVQEELIEVALVGADAEMFQPHERGQGKVGFCSSFLPRKGGQRILELVRSMPETEFVLCGKKWNEWPQFEELRALPNFEYIEIPYSKYPQFYQSLDVFVSVSDLEGGPVPLIESAMCNVVPVCSNTGHASDIINHGVNGFVFDTNASCDEIQTLIRLAQQLTTNVRATVEHLTWQRFSHQIQEIAGLRPRSSTCKSAITEAA